MAIKRAKFEPKVALPSAEDATIQVCEKSGDTESPQPSPAASPVLAPRPVATAVVPETSPDFNSLSRDIQALTKLLAQSKESIQPVATPSPDPELPRENDGSNLLGEFHAEPDSSTAAKDIPNRETPPTDPPPEQNVSSREELKNFADEMESLTTRNISLTEDILSQFEAVRETYDTRLRVLEQQIANTRSFG